MKAIFAKTREAGRNTLEIAEKCNREIQFGKLHYPGFHPPEHFTREGYLRHLLAERLRTRYGVHSRAEGEQFIVERVEDTRRLPPYSSNGNATQEAPLSDAAVSSAAQADIDR